MPNVKLYRAVIGIDEEAEIVDYEFREGRENFHYRGIEAHVPTPIRKNEAGEPDRRTAFARTPAAAVEIAFYREDEAAASLERQHSAAIKRRGKFAALCRRMNETKLFAGNEK